LALIFLTIVIIKHFKLLYFFTIFYLC